MAQGLGIDEQSQAELAAAMSDQNNLIQALEIPPGLPFDQPEKKVITWNVALNADELIGLLGTFSWVILMEDEARDRLFETARRVLATRSASRATRRSTSGTGPRCSRRVATTDGAAVGFVALSRAD